MSEKTVKTTDIIVAVRTMERQLAEVAHGVNTVLMAEALPKELQEVLTKAFEKLQNMRML